MAFARALGRRGRLDEALAEAKGSIDIIVDGSINLNSTLAGEAYATAAGVLRRKGDDLAAATHLGALLDLLDARSRDAWRVRARILDERGLAYQRLNQLDDARSDFEAAVDLRKQHDHVLELAQSMVNLLRLAVRQQDLESADRTAMELLESLNGTSPSDLHANVWMAIAQLRLRQGDPLSGITFATQALRLNEQLENISGTAKSLLVLTQCCRSAGLHDDARKHAQRCIEINELIGNDFGVSKAQWQIDQLPPSGVHE